VVSDLAGRLRERRFYKTLDLTFFGHNEGRLANVARNLDRKRKTGAFKGYVFKDEGAALGLYTEVGGDDDKIHKKLHIVDAEGAQEVSLHSRLIRNLAEAPKRRLTRYYFENESDRETARAIMRRGERHD
jgi:pyruvate-formate lyase